uniref:Uncharacterized protein n=1 Tax=Salix viminalis TaxID=40686 RepID=A0A6N2LFP2_SALVM
MEETKPLCAKRNNTTKRSGIQLIFQADPLIVSVYDSDKAKLDVELPPLITKQLKCPESPNKQSLIIATKA